MPIEIKDLHACDACDGHLTGENGRTPLFYVVRYSQALINARGINRHLGLAQVFGGGNAGMALANVMGPSEPAAEILGDQDGLAWGEMYLCQDCWLERFGVLNEKVLARTEKAETE